MAIQRKEEQKETDFLDMRAAAKGAGSPEPDTFLGWPTKSIKPTTVSGKEGRVEKIRTPVMDLEGLLTPTELVYVVQHFGPPQPVKAQDWSLKVHGEVKRPLELSYDDVRRFPGRTVRTVMECSGSDADFFPYFKGEKPRPSRTNECMIISASEWTGTPLAAVLNEAGLTGKAAYVRAEGWDKGVPTSVTPTTKGLPADVDPFYYDKGLPLEKALHPDTILAWAQNGKLLEHLHGSPLRLVVPGWNGNWSVKWLTQLEVMDHMPDCFYHWQFYYYGDSADDPNKELITTIPVKSMVTTPKDDDATWPRGAHVLRGYAWSGGGAITSVDVSTDGGETWTAAYLEEPRERYMWVRWSYLWDIQKSGKYTIMSRAKDEVGRIQSREPRYNFMEKNFNAIVGNDVTIQ